MLTQTADQVAEAGFRVLMRGDRVVIPGLMNRVALLGIRAAPRTALLKAIDARQKRRRSAQAV
jgi:short-subunit dehydrogenase